MIVAGAPLAYRLVAGALGMGPTQVSRLDTAPQFLLLLGVLAVLAGHLAGGRWVDLLKWATLVTIAISGAHYVLTWGRKAAREHRGAVRPRRGAAPRCASAPASRRPA